MENVQHSIEIQDGKNYSERFTKVTCDLHEDVVCYLRVRAGATTENQLKMVNISSELRDPNEVINGKSSFEIAMDAIDDIKSRYVHASRDKDWDQIQEGHWYANFVMDQDDVRQGISWVTQKVKGLSDLLAEYEDKTGIPCSRMTPAESIQSFVTHQAVVPQAEIPPRLASTIIMQTGAGLPSEVHFGGARGRTFNPTLHSTMQLCARSVATRGRGHRPRSVPSIITQSLELLQFKIGLK